jgi:hypothetical protein
MNEEWRPILGYENYEVSNYGNIKSFVRYENGKVLKCCCNKIGYLQIGLHGKLFYVHRLVLQTFNSTEEDLECNHKNHIKTDNRLCNLEWVSKSQNLRFRKKWKSSSQYRGVYWVKQNKKWSANCNLNGKKNYIGTFDTEEEGAKAYNNFVIKNGLQDFNILNNI